MSYGEEYFCPNCNAVLNDQPGFDPNLGAWTCTACGKTLFGSDIEETMCQFDGVVWYCDSCGAILNKQSGFYDSCGTWYCTDCGHANPINETEIYESEADYQNNSYGVANIESVEDDEDEDDDEDDEDSSSYSSGYYSTSSSQNYRSSDRESSPSWSIGSSSIKPKRSGWKAKFILTLTIIFAVVIGIGYYEYSRLIPVQYSAADLVGKEFETVKAELKAVGFTFVTENRITDLPIQDRTSENLVTEVKIGWITDFSEDSKIPSNFPVVVTYHTLARVAVPMSSKEAKGKNYEEVIKAFEDAGFINIEVTIEYDIITGWITDDGEVESVVIGESKKFSSDSTFRPDETVTITYHTLKKNKPG